MGALAPYPDAHVPHKAVRIGLQSAIPAAHERPVARFTVVQRNCLDYCVERTLAGSCIAPADAVSWRSEPMTLAAATIFAAQAVVRFQERNPDYVTVAIPLPADASPLGSGRAGRDPNDEHRLSREQLGVGSAGRF